MLKKLKNTDKDILPFIKNVGLLSLGIIWCFYILYIRVFITRIPYTLESLYERFGTYLLYTFVFGITIRIFLVMISSYNIYRTYRPMDKKTSGKYISWLLNKIGKLVDIFYSKPLTYLRENVENRIPRIGNFFLFLDSKWKDNPHKWFYPVITGFYFVPKIVVSIVFLYEIVIMNRIFLFFYSLTLLLIPMIFKTFILSFQNFATINIEEIKSWFKSIEGKNPICDENGNIIRDEKGFCDFEYLKWELKEENAGVDGLKSIELLRQVDRLKDWMDDTLNIMSKYSNYCTLLTSIIYIIGGSYRLMYLFNLV